jgi:hypothetical protein
VDNILLIMTFTPLPEPGSLGVVQFPMHRFTDRHGPFLMGRDQGQIARAELERALFGRQTGEEPVYIDFSGVQGMSVPFAEGFFVPLLSSRAIPGYYGEHPIVVAHAQPDVADTVSAVLRQSNLAVVSLQTDAVADLLGEQPTSATRPNRSADPPPIHPRPRRTRIPLPPARNRRIPSRQEVARERGRPGRLMTSTQWCSSMP